MTGVLTNSDLDSGGLEEVARTASNRVHSDPVGAEADLRAVLAAPTASLDARITAGWGLGRLLHDRGEVAEACAVFAGAVAEARRARRHEDEARLRMSWALSLQVSGDPGAALEQLRRAERWLADGERGRLLSQRGYVYMFLGRTRAAIDAYDSSLPLLAAAGDRLAEARVVGNRGIARAHLGDLAGAQTDFRRARAIADELGEHVPSAVARHNLGWVQARLGNLVAALAEYDSAQEAYEGLGSPGRFLAALDTDRCDALLTAGLAVEALEVADRLVDQARASGDDLQHGEAMLARARALMLLGRDADASAQAAEAAETFARSDRTPWAALAQYVAVRGEAAHRERQAEPLTASILERLRTVGAALDDAGWIAESAEVRVLAGRVALELGERQAAESELAFAARARRAPAARARAEGWLATALLRHAEGDPRGALRAVAAGLRAVEQHRSTLGASELRARASLHGLDLSRLALGIASSGGRPTAVFAWAERWRAGALVTTDAAARRRDQQRIAADLGMLRALHARAREATLAGEHTAGSQAESIRATERRIAHRSRLVAGDGVTSTRSPSLADVRDGLGDAALVEYVETGGELLAVVVDRRRSRLVRLCAVAALAAANDHLLFAARRLSAMPPGHPGVSAVVDAFRRAATEVDAMVCLPLALAAGRPRVIVPTGILHGVTWGALPSLHEASVTVAPSAASWLTSAADDPALRRGGVALIGGPDLLASEAELSSIAALYPDVVLLEGDGGTVEAALSAMAGADVAHIAAHGSFRADNPMFSSLRLVDGPLCVYDVEGLAAPPRVVVMTACHAGRSSVLAGDELIGTAATLLSLGVRSVIAPLLAVPDAATARFAVDIHRAMSAGASSADALAHAARRARASGDSTSLAVSAAFQCVGVRAGSSAQRSAMALR